MADYSPVELLELFQRAQALFTDRVDAVDPDQWEDEALPGWTVADLVAHLVGEHLWAPPLLTGEPHGAIHAELRRISGGPAVAQASIEQIQKRIDVLRSRIGGRR